MHSLVNIMLKKTVIKKPKDSTLWLKLGRKSFFSKDFDHFPFLSDTKHLEVNVVCVAAQEPFHKNL